MTIGPREIAAGVALALALGTEAWLFAALVSPGGPLADTGAWLGVHLAASVLAAGASSLLVGGLLPGRSPRVFVLTFVLGATMPLLGAIGASAALLFGFGRAIARHRDVVYWRFTDNPELPFTPPPARHVGALDGRGVAEQLAEGDDLDRLYRQVLAVGRIRSSLSIEALSAAIAHPDERIRLTAYQTLDRKVSRLNAEIQRLEALADGLDAKACASAWLQVASNYWELLTLEQGEPVARAQLLERAADASLRAIVARPDSRNAHFTFGRVSLRQGEPERARVAFERATALGMPEETTLPYLAEAAFDARRFDRVGSLLGGIDAAFLAYPPLREVAAQWR